MKYFNYFIDWYYRVYVTKPCFGSAATDKQHPWQVFSQAPSLYSSSLQNAGRWSSAYPFLFILKAKYKNITVADTWIISSSILMVLKIEIKNYRTWSSSMAGTKIEPLLRTCFFFLNYFASFKLIQNPVFLFALKAQVSGEPRSEQREGLSPHKWKLM